MALAAGGLAVAPGLRSLGPILAQDPGRVVTPEQVMGPFYPMSKPLDRDADLTVIRGKRGRAQGSTPGPLDPNFQGYCIIKTDADGRYRFKSIKPGAYPIGPGVVRPPHIHFEVLGHRDRLVTQMYFPEDPLNEKDDIFRQLGRFRGAAIGKVLPPTKELEPDSKLVLWDIVLDRG